MESVVVVLIVVAAALLTARALYRDARNKKVRCACAEECPLSTVCEPDRRQCVEGLEATDSLRRQARQTGKGAANKPEVCS
jgi:hypothetical protein